MVRSYSSSSFESYDVSQSSDSEESSCWDELHRVEGLEDIETEETNEDQAGSVEDAQDLEMEDLDTEHAK